MLSRLLAVAGVIAIAVSCQAEPATPVGTLTSTFGTARVSGTAVPSGAAVFPGDTIETGAAQAIFTLSGGDSIMLGANARVRVSRAGNRPAIEVLEGMSRVQMRSEELRLMASNWTLEPRRDARTGRTVVDVLRDSKGAVSVNVQEGELLARNAAGKPFATVPAGRPMMLPASAVPPSAPQGGSSGGTSAATVGAYALAAAAIAVGVAAINSDDTTDDEARASAAALRSELQALQAQNQALQSQVTALLARVGSLEAAGSLSRQLASLLSRLQAVQDEINSILDQLLDPNLTDAQRAALRARLATLRSAQEGINQELSGIIDALGDHFG